MPRRQNPGPWRSSVRQSSPLSDTWWYLSLDNSVPSGDIRPFDSLFELRAAKDAEGEMRQLAEEATSAPRMKMNFQMSIVSQRS